MLLELHPRAANRDGAERDSAVVVFAARTSYSNVISKVKQNTFKKFNQRWDNTYFSDSMVLNSNL